MFLIADGQAKDLADETAGQLGGRVAGRWHEVVQHVPVELAERARAAVTDADADAVVCLGGGSSTGLAKAIALTHRLPIVAVPTTYAGSEMTTIYGLTGGRHKQTGTSPDVLPKVVIYDPLLTLGLPPNVTGAERVQRPRPLRRGAVRHRLQPGDDGTGTGRGAGDRSLAPGGDGRRLADVGGRSDLLYGAYLSGIALGTTSAGLHHKLCHVLGGTFNLVHADAHAAVLPHAVAFNAPALPVEMARLADALGAPGRRPGRCALGPRRASGVTTRLADLGLTAADLPEAAERAAEGDHEQPGRLSTPMPSSASCAARSNRDAAAGRDRSRLAGSAAGIRLPPLAPGTGAFEEVRRDALRRRRTTPPHRPRLPRPARRRRAARRERRDPRTPAAASPAASSGTACARRR